MTFKIWGRRVPNVVEKGPHKGCWNSTVADLVVFTKASDPYAERVELFNSRLRNPPMLGLFLGCDDWTEDEIDYKIYAFECSSNILSNLKSQSNAFDSIRLLVPQCLNAIEYIHSKDCVGEDLSDMKSYLYYKTNVTVKLHPYKCLLDSNVDSKVSDYRNFAKMLCSHFFGPDVSIQEALKYSFSKNKPPIHCVPEFSNYRHEMAYRKEVIQFLKKAYRTCATAFPPTSLNNDPMTWTSPKRLAFYVVAAESISSVDSEELFQELIKINGFTGAGGVEWLNFHFNVRADLNSYVFPENSSFVPTWETAKKYKYTRGSAFDFLRCVRNFVAHGFKNAKGINQYMEYDRDVNRGLDLLLSCTMPNFFMSVYESLRKEWKDGVIVDRSLDRFFDPNCDEMKAK